MQHPKAAAGAGVKVKIDLPENIDDDIEMEEQIHDYDKMVAMSIIEAEMNLM